MLEEFDERALVTDRLYGRRVVEYFVEHILHMVARAPSKDSISSRTALQFRPAKRKKKATPMTTSSILKLDIFFT
jgi:hypothetical protein